MIPDYVDASFLDDHIRLSLREDAGAGDVTSRATIEAGSKASATFLSKANGIVAGCELASLVFSIVDDGIECAWTVADGDRVSSGQTLGHVSGHARSILLAERLVLNYMQRMSGIASATRAMVDAVAGTGALILDTRKTAPGLRKLDKWAVALGGGTNHRFGLYDLILIKDNHIAASGGIEQALRLADDFRKSENRDLEIEIEAKTIAQVRTILATGLADIIMLDNMAVPDDTGSLDTSMLEEALAIIDRKVRTEASGNVTLETVGTIAQTGVDAISSGALTHSVRALDISLNIEIHAQ